jgi:hypothetical protein
MAHRGWGVLTLLAFACALGACAFVDPVDNRYDTVGRSLAKARNEAIFLNLVRASHDYPLSFTTIANVTPSMTNTSSLALPNFLLGPHIIPVPGSAAAIAAPQFSPGRDVIFGNTTASNSTAVSTNFNVSTQETSAFYEGFLKPIDLTTLDYFIRQGYPPELLFWLFTDSFELDVHGHSLGYRYNPPDDYGCAKLDPKHRCFLDWIHIATAAGLTVEEVTQQKLSGGGGGGGGKEGGGGGGSSSKPTTLAFTRFCFNQVLAQRALALMPPDLIAQIKRDLDVPTSALSPRCHSKWDPLATAEEPQPDVLPFHVGPVTFKIIPRSAYGVFEFLGSIMKMQRLHNVDVTAYVPPGRDEIILPPVLATIHDDPNLLTVVQDNGGPCFSHTWFIDGDYCVPEGAATTKRIFSLLAQLIAIQTAATDLSITPVVRVIQ